MNKTSIAIALGGAFLAFAPQAAFAQMGPPTGAELIGQSVQAETNGVVNTIYFDPGGTARIMSPAGREVQGNWFVENGRMCLQTGTGRECWTYGAPFVAGQPVSLTSDCGTSRWTAVSTAQPMMPEPPPVRQGERG